MCQALPYTLGTQQTKLPANAAYILVTGDRGETDMYKVVTDVMK